MAKRSTAELLVNAAIVWHGATVLSGQIYRDSRADKFLRQACIRHLKAKHIKRQKQKRRAKSKRGAR